LNKREHEGGMKEMDEHIPTFLFEMYMKGRMSREELNNKYKEHIDSCDDCSKTLKEYDKARKLR
jgi:hypothetical protein